MKLLLAGVLLLHLCLVALCFGAAIVQPERSGLAPVFVHLADYPASLLAAWTRGPVADALGAEGYVAGLLVDAVIYGVVGSAWWLFLVGGLSWLVRASARRA